MCKAINSKIPKFKICVLAYTLGELKLNLCGESIYPTRSVYNANLESCQRNHSLSHLQNNCDHNKNFTYELNGSYRLTKYSQFK